MGHQWVSMKPVEVISGRVQLALPLGWWAGRDPQSSRSSRQGSRGIGPNAHFPAGWAEMVKGGAGSCKAALTL
eukprot:254727-Chlamydomonas_euryale.AAC.9